MVKQGGNRRAGVSNWPVSEHSSYRGPCIFSDHKKNNQQKEFYFESHPVDPRIRDRRGCVCPSYSLSWGAEKEHVRIQTRIIQVTYDELDKQIRPAALYGC